MPHLGLFIGFGRHERSARRVRDHFAGRAATLGGDLLGRRKHVVVDLNGLAHAMNIATKGPHDNLSENPIEDSPTPARAPRADPPRKGEGERENAAGAALYTGKLSCFRPGISTCLLRSMASARAMRWRVACGMITSSI